MRIAIVTTSWPRAAGDAAGHFVQTEARELEQAGHDVQIVAPTLTAGAFGWPGVAARVRERPFRALGAASWVLEARARVQSLAIDRVVAHWAVPCAWPIGVSAHRAELHVVSHGADVRLLVAMPLAFRERLASSIARRASSWRFVSEALCRQLVETLGAQARARVERIAEVRAAAFEMPDVRDAGARLRKTLDIPRMAVSIGRLVASKRVDLAIDYLEQARIADALIVVGDGPERTRLERRARLRGVDARFVGLLPRTQALAWMAAADVVLHASEREGLSTVVREAEAMGKPVVRIRH